ncbi:MAG: hypothetical protein ACOVRM_04405 [Planctomycetaceae bacterium]
MRLISAGSECVVAAALLLAACGCGQQASEQPAAAAGSTAGTADAAAVKPVALRAADEPQSQQLAEQVRQAVAHLDAAALTKLASDEAFADRVLRGTDVSGSERREAVEGLSGTLQEIFTGVVQGCTNGGSYSFVRMVPRGGEFRPLFRLCLPELSGINYHELVVVQTAEGAKIADVDVYLSGECVSESLRRLVLPALAASNRGLKASLSASEVQLLEFSDDVREIGNLQLSGQPKSALELFRRLPTVVQESEPLRRLKVRICRNLGPDELAEALQQLFQATAAEPGAGFAEVERLELLGQHAEVAAAVDRLREQTGDPYLGLLKIESLLKLDRGAEAAEAVAAAKAVSEGDADVALTDLRVRLHRRDFAGVAELLEGMQQSPDGAAEIPEYQEFLRSEAGQAWLQRQKTQSESP